MSSFIQELPEGVICRESAGITKAFPGMGWQNSESSGYRQNEMGSSGLFQGDRVKHPAFGPGIVSKLIADDKVEVLFRNAGRKLLHLEYTTLEKI